MSCVCILRVCVPYTAYYIIVSIAIIYIIIRVAGTRRADNAIRRYETCTYVYNNIIMLCGEGVRGSRTSCDIGTYDYYRRGPLKLGC